MHGLSTSPIVVDGLGTSTTPTEALEVLARFVARRCAPHLVVARIWIRRHLVEVDAACFSPDDTIQEACLAAGLRLRSDRRAGGPARSREKEKQRRFPRRKGGEATQLIQGC
jgi:hypothetical protein